MSERSETVRDVCAKMKSYPLCWLSPKDIEQMSHDNEELRKYADRILSANERELAAKDAEIARLKAALKPVMEFDENQHDKMLNALRAVREAQRIMKEFTNGESHN